MMRRASGILCVMWKGWWDIMCDVEGLVGFLCDVEGLVGYYVRCGRAGGILCVMWKGKWEVKRYFSTEKRFSKRIYCGIMWDFEELG